MSFELKSKTVYPTGRGYYHWEHGPLENEEDGWKKAFEVIRALAETAGGVKITDVPGPYANEKEYGDIGWKNIKELDKLEESLPDLLKDENSEVKFSVDVNGDVVKVDFDIDPINKSVDISVAGNDEKAIKFVSTIIKKALGE